MILKGLRFGMLLQLAIGPMCLMVFHVGATYGFFYGLHLVLAIALIDALYIALSGIGIAAVINRAKVKAVIKGVGCLVLIAFGVNTVTGVFEISFLPTLQLFSNISGKSLFAQGILLTASNPMTIIFWSGMFSAQMIENNWNKQELFLFAVGCVLSTLIFLTLVDGLGNLVSGFLPQGVIQFLNVAVGIVLILPDFFLFLFFLIISFRNGVPL